ncbi:hypothetical protein LX32DRAFT_617695 [Colletotrichum zoysiae]|uniref:Uncharacterized protein n=1 Tax=Colletotrichum zoysiae TaxID=1216348 RepID=A0AAD9HJD5_9PEZI|nr:hypothetical protein LX32DRAFT_617695 [Colletotrichum zoysiae]
MVSVLIEKGKGVSSEVTAVIVQSVLKERDKMFSKPDSAVRKKDGLVEELVRSAAAGIGVISEALHHRKEKKAKDIQTNGIRGPQPSRVSSQSRPDRVQSYLDAGNRAVMTSKITSKSPKNSKDSSSLAEAFVTRHPYLAGDTISNDKTLSLPVVLPQRRPEKRARGFIRAYAPVLAEVGIDQETFIEFVDTFNKALEPSPWINALNLSGIAGSAMPEPASMLFGLGVEYATEAALEGHSRYSSNAFLDLVNAQYFRPRGLVCLVVTWQPGTGDNQLAVNFDGGATGSHFDTGILGRVSDIVTQKTSAMEGWQGIKDQVREMMKMSNGNLDSPEPAPLIFPACYDEGCESGSGTGVKKKRKALDRMEAWMEDISDKRAQTRWVDENSDKPSAGLMPNHEFRSRYADPQHPAASGDMVALVTGGRWVYADKKSAKGGAAESKPDIDNEKKSRHDQSSTREKQKNNADGSDDGIHNDKPQKADDDKNSNRSKDEETKKDVLYLVVINLPTKQQLEDANDASTNH